MLLNKFRPSHRFLCLNMMGKYNFNMGDIWYLLGKKDLNKTPNTDNAFSYTCNNVYIMYLLCMYNTVFSNIFLALKHFFFFC